MVTVSFGCDACDTLEITEKRTGFGKTQRERQPFERLRGISFNHPLRLGDDILLNPLLWRETVGGFTYNLFEKFGMNRHPVEIKLHILGFAEVHDDEVAELCKEHGMTVGIPFMVKLLAVVIDELVSDRQL